MTRRVVPGTGGIAFTAPGHHFKSAAMKINDATAAAIAIPRVLD